MAERSQALPAAAWREITIAQGSQGPRVYRFSAQRVRVTRRRKPGEVLWAVYRQGRQRTPLVQRPRGHPSGDKMAHYQCQELGRVGITTCACWRGLLTDATGLGGKRCP